MAIQEIEIQGFRSYQKAVWRPGRLNLLVGPNGSGKSNLLHILELISSTARKSLAKAVSESYGISPLLWNHRARSLGWRIKLDPVAEGGDAISDAITFELMLEQLPRTSSYQITKDTLGRWYDFLQGSQTQPLWFFTRDAVRAHVHDGRDRRLVPVHEFDENESLLPQVGDPFSNFLVTRFCRVLEAWRIHHDVHAERGSAMRMPATTQHTTLVSPDGSNLATVLHTLYTSDWSFKQQINEGMKAAFGDEFEEVVIQPVAAQQIQLAVKWRSCSQPHAGLDLSDGTLRYLFLLTVLASPDPAPLIAVDEPEVGLHPSMLPIVAEYAASAAERTQVIMTSHSPEFLDAFTDFAPQVTVCHWEDGQTELYTLPSERLSKWLERYRLGQLFNSGDLDALARPDVEPVAEERLRGLPPEDEALARLADDEPRSGR